MVEPIHKSTREQREQWLKDAHYNVFQLPAEQVYIDLITDSGTGAMSDRQWAGMMLGDESYAGATSFFKLKDTITRLTGFEYVIPTHQGRAAENVLFSYLVHEGDIVPGNSHFDTTKGHIEARHATAWDITVDEARDTQLEIPFKGNADPRKLEAVLAEHADRLADRIRAAFQEKGFELVCENTTNQIFVILPNAAVKALSEQFVLSLDQVVDDGHQMVRICTSWATKEEDADKLIQAIRQI